MLSSGAVAGNPFHQRAGAGYVIDVVLRTPAKRRVEALDDVSVRCPAFDRHGVA